MVNQKKPQETKHVKIDAIFCVSNDFHLKNSSHHSVCCVPFLWLTDLETYVQGHDLRDTVLYIDPNSKCHKSDERCDDVPLEKDFSIELHALYPIDTLMHSPNHTILKV